MYPTGLQPPEQPLPVSIQIGGFGVASEAKGARIAISSIRRTRGAPQVWIIRTIH